MLRIHSEEVYPLRSHGGVYPLRSLRCRRKPLDSAQYPDYEPIGCPQGALWSEYNNVTLRILSFWVKFIQRNVSDRPDHERSVLIGAFRTIGRDRPKIVSFKEVWAERLRLSRPGWGLEICRIRWQTDGFWMHIVLDAHSWMNTYLDEHLVWMNKWRVFKRGVVSILRIQNLEFTYSFFSQE